LADVTLLCSKAPKTKTKKQKQNENNNKSALIAVKSALYFVRVVFFPFEKNAFPFFFSL
jgi:CMP-2-keto-3-deoxyoctulosonic acid synthetase